MRNLLKTRKNKEKEVRSSDLGDVLVSEQATLAMRLGVIMPILAYCTLLHPIAAYYSYS